MIKDPRVSRKEYLINEIKIKSKKISRIVLSPDDKFLIVGYADIGVVEIFDVNTQKSLISIDISKKIVSPLRFPITITNINVSPDSMYLFFGVQNTQLFIFSLESFNEIGFVITEMNLRDCVTYSKNDQLYFISHGNSGLKNRGENYYNTIIIWKFEINKKINLKEIKEIRFEYKAFENSYLYLPTNFVISGNHQVIFGEHKLLSIIDFEIEDYDSFELQGLNVNIDINTDENLILIGGSKLFTFNIEDKTKITTYKFPGKLSNYLTTYNTFINNNFLMAGFNNGELVLWNVLSKESLLRFGDHYSKLIYIKATLNQKFIITVGWQTIKFWNYNKIIADCQEIRNKQLNAKKVKEKEVKEKNTKIEFNTRKYILELYKSYKQVSLNYITFTTHIKKEKLKRLIEKMVMNKEIDALILGDFLIFNIHNTEQFQELEMRLQEIQEAQILISLGNQYILEGQRQIIEEFKNNIEEFSEYIIENQDTNVLVGFLEKEKKNPDEILKKVFKNMKKHNWNEENVEEFLMKLYIALRKYKLLNQAFKPTWKEKLSKVITKCVEMALGKAVGELAGRGINLLIEKIGLLLES